MKVCLDPGHGMSNARPGVYDTGAAVKVDGVEVTEAGIVMKWANELRSILQGQGHKVTRTRVDEHDPAPVGERAGIAKKYGCDMFIALHCNCANGKAKGTETFYRGEHNRTLAEACNESVVRTLNTLNRGVKTEQESQHTHLAVLNFPRAVLIELGFIDHAGDRAKLMDETLMHQACEALADVITS